MHIIKCFFILVELLAVSFPQYLGQGLNPKKGLASATDPLPWQDGTWAISVMAQRDGHFHSNMGVVLINHISRETNSSDEFLKGLLLILIPLAWETSWKTHLPKTRFWTFLVFFLLLFFLTWNFSAFYSTSSSCILCMHYRETLVFSHTHIINISLWAMVWVPHLVVLLYYAFMGGYTPVTSRKVCLVRKLLSMAA